MRKQLTKKQKELVDLGLEVLEKRKVIKLNNIEIILKFYKDLLKDKRFMKAYFIMFICGIMWILVFHKYDDELIANIISYGLLYSGMLLTVIIITWSMFLRFKYDKCKEIK